MPGMSNTPVLMLAEAPETEVKTIERPKESEHLPFCFGGVKEGPSGKLQQRQTFKPRDFSELDLILQDSPRAKPLFGAQTQISADPPKTVVDTSSVFTEQPLTRESPKLRHDVSNPLDLASLRIPIEDFDSYGSKTDQESNQMTAHKAGLTRLGNSHHDQHEPSRPAQQVDDFGDSLMKDSSTQIDIDFVGKFATPALLTPMKSSRARTRLAVDQQLLQDESTMQKGLPDMARQSTVGHVDKRACTQEKLQSQRRSGGADNVLKDPKNKILKIANPQTFENLLRISTPSLYETSKITGPAAIAPRTDHYAGQQRRSVPPPASQLPESKRQKVGLRAREGESHLAQVTSLDKRASSLPRDAHGCSSVPVPSRAKCSSLSSHPVKQKAVRPSNRFTPPEMQSFDTDTGELPEMTLVREMQHMRLRIQSLSDDLHGANEQIALSQKQTNAEQLQNEHLRANNHELQAEIKRLHALDQERSRKIKDVRERHKAALVSLHAAQNDTVAIKERLQSHSQAIIQITDDIRATKSQITSVSDMFEIRTHNARDSISTLRDLQLEYEKERLRAQSLKEICDRNAGTMSEDRDRIADLSKQVSALLALQESIQTSHCKESKSYDQRVHELSHEVHSLRSEAHQDIVRSLDQVVANLDGLMTSSRTRLDQLLSSTASIQPQVDSLVSKSVELEKTIVNKAQLCEIVSLERDRICSELEHAKDRIAEMTGQLAWCEGDRLRISKDNSKLEESNNIRFLEYQNTCQATALAQSTNLQNTCDTLRQEVERLQLSLAEAEQADKCSKEKLKVAEGDLSKTRDDQRVVEQKLRLEFEMESKSHEERYAKIKEQELMRIENQLKSQSTRLVHVANDLSRARADETAALDRIRELEASAQEHAVLQAEIGKLRQEDFSANEVLDNHEKDKAKILLLETKVKQREIDLEGYTQLKSSYDALQEAHLTANRLLEVLRKEIYELKSVKMTSASQNATKSRNKSLRKSTKEIGKEVRQFATINHSSDSISFDEDDLNDFDFVHDTPPKLAATAPQTKVRKEKTQDKKRRSLPADFNRTCQEEPEESYLQSNVVAGRATNAREEKTTRNRNTNRQGYKKRKSA